MDFKFSQLNILIGMNGAGKSTILQALDFISHAYLNSDIVDTTNANTQFVLFSCKSNDGTDNGEYMAVRNGNSFNIVNTNNQ